MSHYYDEEGIWDKHKWKIISLVVVLLVIFFPVKKDAMVTEHYTEEIEVLERELKQEFDCDIEIKTRDTVEESYTDLGDNIRIVIDVASTQDINLEIQSSEKLEINEKAKIFNYNFTTKGTSLVIKMFNPNYPIVGRDAQLSGKIQIYHEYLTVETIDKTRQVPGKVWTIWWFRYIE